MSINIFFGLVMAVLAGLMTASWGAYKDTPYEGFRWESFLRSVVSTLGFFVVLGWMMEMFDMEASVVLLVLAAMAFERISHEIWKGLFRRKQRKGIYKIPQSFHYLGRVVPYRWRLPLGIGVVLFLVGASYWSVQIKTEGVLWLMVGVSVAVFASVGGAWKDAPIEGFNWLKFPRSFLLIMGCFWLLKSLTDSLLILIMGAAGLERIMVEFYKSFVVKRTPGKFVERVKYGEWKDKRWVFVLSYSIAVTLLVVCVWLSW
mgnify:CR=1 FL=1